MAFPDNTTPYESDGIDLLLSKLLAQTIINGSGGGGGAATIADGADVAEGTKADAAITDPNVSASTIALQKGILTQLLSLLFSVGPGDAAAVVTDADGSLQQYLRGLVAMAASGTLVKQGGGALTDRSGTVTAGGTSQQIAAANTARKVFFYQNTSDETQYLNFGAAASAANSIEIASKGYWESPPNFCPTGTVNMLGATTAKSFTAKEG